MESDKVNGSYKEEFKALVVDDDPVCLTHIKRALESIKINVVEVDSALKAFQLLNKGLELDIILSDIMMPDLDGYNLIWAFRTSRKYQKYKNLPILAITSLSGVVVKARLKEIQADAWIRKPISTERLCEIVSSYLFEKSTVG